MSPKRNIRAAQASLLRITSVLCGTSLAALLALIITLSPARADTLPADAEPAAPRVARPDALHAYQWLDQWLMDGHVPAEPEQAMPVRGLIGLRVTVWLDGVAIGSGQAFRPDLSQVAGELGPPVAMGPLLVSAAADAFTNAQVYLRRAHADAQGLGLQDRPDAQAPRLADLAHRVQLDLQVGHTLEPVVLPEDAEPTELFNHIAFGFHGLHVPGDHADSIERTVTWPATALARNIEPTSQIRSLLHAQGHPAHAVLTVGQPDGPPLQRFQVIHIVKPGFDQRPIELIRGQEIVPPHPLSERRIENLLHRMGEHLEQRFTRDMRVRGDYHPTSNQYDPDLASAHDAALAAYALLRFALSTQNLQVDGGHETGTSRRATAVARELARDQVREGGFEPATAALVLLTLVHHPDPATVDRQLRDTLAHQLLERYNAQAGGFAGIGADDMARRALVVAGLSSWYARSLETEAAAVIARELDALWSVFAQTPNLAAMPWFMHACHVAAEHLAEADDAFAQRWPTLQQEIARLSVRLMDRVVYHSQANGPDDVVGGFEIHPAADNASPRPDWRTTQFLALLGIGLREPAIVQHTNELDWLLAAGLNARFVHQLTLDEITGYYVQSPRDAHHGLRLAFWDNKIAVAPHAMGVLAMVELHEALQAMRARQGGE